MKTRTFLKIQTSRIYFIFGGMVGREGQGTLTITRTNAVLGSVMNLNCFEKINSDQKLSNSASLQ